MKAHLYILTCLLLAASGFSRIAKHGPSVDSSNLDNSSHVKNLDSIPYSTFYFYRSYIPKMNAPLKKVPIYINDTLVTELKANRAAIFRISNEGKFNISVDKKGESQFAVKVKFGKNYFFKCEVVKGLWGGKPTIEAVSEKIGREESGILEKN